MKEITSLTNELVKNYTSLNKKKIRDEQRLFIVDGDHLVLEAKKYGLLETVLFNDKLPKELKDFPNLIKVTDGIIKKISNVDTPKNIVGICHYKEDALDTDYSRFIALDGVQDPGNGGTILRSALAFNYDCMLLSEDSCDMYNPKFIRATMGAFFALPIVRGNLTENLLKLKTDGYQVIVGDLTKDSIDLEELKPNKDHVLVVGNEGNGPNEKTKNIANTIVKIDIDKNIDSLNVGVAASILMYHCNKTK